MKFYTQLPADKYGNTAHTEAVVQGEIIDNHLKITAPADYPWKSIDLRAGSRWVECQGPARYLTWQEWNEIVNFS